MPSKPTSKKPQTKTAYVLGFPHSVPAKDVVVKGKAAGVALTDKLVWAIRSDAKKKKGARKSKARHTTTTPRSSGMRVSARVAEDVLRAAAHVLGLARASEILDEEQRRAHALLT